MRVGKAKLSLIFKKLQALLVILITLFVLQSEFPSFALTLNDNHQHKLSVKQLNGSTYLVLAHSEHTHSHPHTHKHFHHHEGIEHHHHSHQDHLIKLPDFESNNTLLSSYEDIDFDYQLDFEDSNIIKKQVLLFSEPDHKRTGNRYRHYQPSSKTVEFRNSIQFLA